MRTGDGSIAFNTNQFGTIVVPSQYITQDVLYNLHEISKSAPNYHEYYVDRNLNLDADLYSEDLVYAALPVHATPTYPVGALPFGITYHTGNGTNTVVNYTTDWHLLNPGVVYRTIVVKDGQYHVRTIGIGNGNLGDLNRGLAPLVWGLNSDAIASWVRDKSNNGIAVVPLYAGDTVHTISTAHCFPAGTEISAPNGAVEIQDVKAGAIVYAFDPNELRGRGGLVPRSVARIFTGVTLEWVRLSDGVVVTPGHHFLASDGRFRTISEILSGDGVIVRADGTTAVVRGELVLYDEKTASQFEQTEGYCLAYEGSVGLQPQFVRGWKTYNFEVEGLHTYIAGGVRVHNQSVFVASGKDVPVGYEYTSGGYKFRVNENGSITNLTTKHTSPAPVAEFSRVKYVGVGALEAETGRNITTSQQDEYASQHAFASVVTLGSGPMITLASGKQIPAGTIHYSTNGYGYLYSADGNITQFKTNGANSPSGGDGGSSGGGSSGGGSGGGSSGGGSSSLTVKSGDTLSAIAKANGTTVSALMTANPGIKDANKIYAGQTINVPKGSTSGSSTSGGGSTNGSGTGSSSGKSKPVLIDLDDDGIEIDDLTASNFFMKVGADGMDHRTAWAGVGDGVLVRDDGNDGVINQYREVIFTEWDPTAKSDFEALRNVFDTNHDGVLSSADADWSLFKVLVTRPDGSTELKTLGELGITSIKLISNQQEINFADGSKISGTATYTKSDGSTGKVGDVSLAMDARIGTRPLAGWSVTPTICGRRRVRNPDEAPGRIRSASRLRHEVELPVQAEREQSARARSGKVA